MNSLRFSFFIFGCLFLSFTAQANLSGDLKNWLTSLNSFESMYAKHNPHRNGSSFQGENPGLCFGSQDECLSEEDALLKIDELMNDYSSFVNDFEAKMIVAREKLDSQLRVAGVPSEKNQDFVKHFMRLFTLIDSSIIDKPESRYSIDQYTQQLETILQALNDVRILFEKLSEKLKNSGAQKYSPAWFALANDLNNTFYTSYDVYQLKSKVDNLRLLATNSIDYLDRTNEEEFIFSFQAGVWNEDISKNYRSDHYWTYDSKNSKYSFSVTDRNADFFYGSSHKPALVVNTYSSRSAVDIFSRPISSFFTNDKVFYDKSEHSLSLVKRRDSRSTEIVMRSPSEEEIFEVLNPYTDTQVRD